jgi:transposase
MASRGRVGSLPGVPGDARTRPCGDGQPTTRAGATLLYNPGWLYGRYVRDDMTQHEVAAITGTNRAAVARALAKYGIQARKAARRFVRPELNDARWLRFQYETLHRTTVQIACELEVTPKSVNKALRRLGIPLRPPRHHRSG